jgi:hypothetical protein
MGFLTAVKSETAILRTLEKVPEHCRLDLVTPINRGLLKREFNRPRSCEFNLSVR